MSVYLLSPQGIICEADNNDTNNSTQIKFTNKFGDIKSVALKNDYNLIKLVEHSPMSLTVPRLSNFRTSVSELIDAAAEASESYKGHVLSFADTPMYSVSDVTLDLVANRIIYILTPGLSQAITPEYFVATLERIVHFLYIHDIDGVYEHVVFNPKTDTIRSVSALGCVNNNFVIYTI